jgi:hypothetical protein
MVEHNFDFEQVDGEKTTIVIGALGHCIAIALEKNGPSSIDTRFIQNFAERFDINVKRTSFINCDGFYSSIICEDKVEEIIDTH